MPDKPIIIIGAGAAGLIAAARAAELGMPVIVLEKQAAPGRKLLLSGAGRCNLTNSAALETFIGQYFGQGRFLYPAFRRFFRPELLDLLQKQQVPVKTEPSGKIFPASDQAADVLAALVRQASRYGVQFRFNEPATAILADRQQVTAVQTGKGHYPAAAVILTCGGQSWPQTGSSGDGFRFAESLGHHLTPPRPALVPLICPEPWIPDISGLSCPAVRIQLLDRGLPAGKADGDLLWTHFGLSGPAILRLSRNLIPETGEPKAEDNRWQVELNLLPQIPDAQIREEISRLCRKNPRQLLRNALDGGPLLPPHALMAALARQAGLPDELAAGRISRAQIECLVAALRRLRLPITGTRGYREAMVTAGGIVLGEVDPRTLGSRIVRGLYLAGEVLDIDGDTGGFNLQAAFSTGFLAGESAARACRPVDTP